jgi:steroid delta-isomerase-like uncharacterized protein
MKKQLLVLIGVIFVSLAHANESLPDGEKQAMGAYKKAVALWYDAFSTNDPRLLDTILDKNWVDIPAPPGQPPGPEGAKQILLELVTTFPDLKVSIKDVLQDGNKVVVRSEISGTQTKLFMGIPARDRKIVIQAIDIHELKEGKIVRTWHTEDWMTGLRQMGAFEK